jgi:proteasome lid subunit RPN8/RPN11
LIFGNSEVEFLRVVRVTNVMTKMHVGDPKAFPRDARHAYYMSEVEYLGAIQEAEAGGEFVSAIYHSHFGQGCYLSQDDLAFVAHPLFPFPFAAQMVVSLLGQGVREVGIFERADGTNSRFVGRLLEAAP